MKLNIKFFALACSLIWGLGLFALTWWVIAFEGVTKKKMVNKTKEMSYFLISKYKLVQWFFNLLLKVTKIQSKDQLRFRD